VDDKDNLAASLMVMLLLKRMKLPLERDVIFLAEAGEEGAVQFGIKFLVENHWSHVEAEYCIAEGGGIARVGGKYQRINIGSAEKIPFAIKLVARGTAGHGSVPLKDNALVQLSHAVSKVAAWRTPMRLNDITRSYFERLATVSSPEARARYNAILSGGEAAEAAQDYLQAHEPRHYSMLRTSISPNIIQGGYRTNVIPSTAEATLDVRVAPGDTGPAVLAEIEKLIANPNVTAQGPSRPGRPLTAPSDINTELFRIIEARGKQYYQGAVVLPFMTTGATDNAYLRSKGVQCYGIGPAIDEEDGPKGYGAHSDQERILIEELYRFARFKWDIVTDLARRRN
jgi:acetylornithine deacetylase/succinyl-diaminopimelate desuccinylase-like protein